MPATTTVQPRRKKRTARPTARRAQPKAAPAAGFPGWDELAGKDAAARKARRSRTDGVPTFRLVLLLAVACAAITVWVGHVQATEDIAAEVQRLERQHLRLTLQHNRLRGAFDRATGPDAVLPRAAALGFTAAPATAPTLALDAD